MFNMDAIISIIEFRKKTNPILGTSNHCPTRAVVIATVLMDERPAHFIKLNKQEGVRNANRPDRRSPGSGALLTFRP